MSVLALEFNCRRRLGSGLGLVYAINLKRPSVQLRQLEDTVKTTDEIIGNAKAHCPRDLLSLTEQGVRLLKIKRSASMIQCRILETDTLSWKRYRALSRDIGDCAKGVKKIRTTVQLIAEAERQRKFTEDINATGNILTCVRSPGMFVRSGQVQFSSPATQTEAYSNIRPMFLAFIKDATASRHRGSHFSNLGLEVEQKSI
ncbi:hypothetical protein B0H13DRAFT_1913543 [Mycena leptocephala]|nr:hypothetical protein B0H13DRAFT_1913543 [Mycena leptocephala]